MDVAVGAGQYSYQSPTADRRPRISIRAPRPSPRSMRSLGRSPSPRTISQRRLISDQSKRAVAMEPTSELQSPQPHPSPLSSLRSAAAGQLDEAARAQTSTRVKRRLAWTCEIVVRMIDAVGRPLFAGHDAAMLSLPMASLHVQWSRPEQSPSSVHRRRIRLRHSRTTVILSSPTQGNGNCHH